MLAFDPRFQQLAMTPLAAYADRLSVRPGETIRFHVANATGTEVAAPTLVRVISADANPAGPGVRVVPIAATVRVMAQPAPQQVVPGSYAVANLGSALDRLQSCTLVATICPTRIAGSSRPILTLFSRLGVGFGLSLDEDASVAATIGRADGSRFNLTTGQALREGAWAQVWMSWDRSTATISVGQQPLVRGQPKDQAIVVTSAEGGQLPAAAGEVLIGASEANGRRATFNGRIERPMVFDRALTTNEVAQAAQGEMLSGLIACWDFAKQIAGTGIIDVGPQQFHGRVVNMPTRAVTGSTWSGREMCWRHAPDEYAAIHFHDDDIVDCGWPATHEWTVPAEFASGSYALMLEAGDAKENVPFFVVPSLGRPGAKIAVLMSTFTYVIYQNNARLEWLSDPEWREAWRARAKAWGTYPHNPGDHPEFGWSTYNYHSDRTGICFASWQRPMLNVRIGYLTYPHEATRGSGLRHYPADHHLLSWLEAKGYQFDVLTDWELHNDGLAALKDYAVLLTGTHPEYHTRAMLDALVSYRDGGGRLCYLGGNGFYWKIAVAPEHPGLLEIRRAEGGIRAWAAEAGEYYNQLDGEYGGLWRRNGRPPQELVGVGFTAQGAFAGSYYRVKPEVRHDPRVAWIFAGVDGDILGDFGLSAHGAAGFELDRTDKRLGTPAHALVLAASENHPAETPWVLVPEEYLTHMSTTTGQPAVELIRADMTFFETGNGKGAVFSTGSITFCGSLPSHGYDNNIARLLQNVLERFLNPLPFVPPGSAPTEA
jgi:N,N-dimethylformamidase